ncbi:hypothetical protein Q3G72_026813 [Acer saccharum]|nr:hypothetical protein Q3G72_014423 [Acer saccharum]KAK1568619.1 hypothetical protein Q3G72_026813 [Acer saccharum]
MSLEVIDIRSMLCRLGHALVEFDSRDTNIFADALAKRGAEGGGKDLWPELVGVRGEEAAATIERENPTVSAEIILDGKIVLGLFLCTRVYVWVNTSGICVKVPMIG